MKRLLQDINDTQLGKTFYLATIARIELLITFLCLFYVYYDITRRTLNQTVVEDIMNILIFALPAVYLITVFISQTLYSKLEYKCSAVTTKGALRFSLIAVIIGILVSLISFLIFHTFTQHVFPENKGWQSASWLLVIGGLVLIIPTLIAEATFQFFNIICIVKNKTIKISLLFCLLFLLVFIFESLIRIGAKADIIIIVYAIPTLVFICSLLITRLITRKHIQKSSKMKQ